MADVASSVTVSKDSSADKCDSPECSDPDNHTKIARPTLSYQEIDSFSELSFKGGDDYSLQDIMESEFEARISSLSAETSPREEKEDFAKFGQEHSDFMKTAVDILQSVNDTVNFDDFLVDVDPIKKDSPVAEEEENKELLVDFLSNNSIKSPTTQNGGVIDLLCDVLEEATQSDTPQSNNASSPANGDMDLLPDLMTSTPQDGSPKILSNNHSLDLSPQDAGSIASPDVVSDNGIPIAEPDLVVTKIPRPTDMPIASSFNPFARIEEDSDASNSNPMSGNINSPDEFSFSESPHEVPPDAAEPMVSLFVKAISDENSDLSDPPQNGLGRFNTSSVESVNNSFPNVSDLTSPDRADHDEFFSDDLMSSEQVETVVEQDEVTSSASHPVDLSAEETEHGLEDQSLHQSEQTGDDWPADKVSWNPADGELVERGSPTPSANSRDATFPLDELAESPLPTEDVETPVIEDYRQEEFSVEEQVTPTVESQANQENIDWKEEVMEEAIVEEPPIFKEPPFEPKLAPIAMEEDIEDWVTVEAALEGGEAEGDQIDVDVGSVTNPSAAFVTNTPDILVEAVVADTPDSEISSETETCSEVSSSEKRTSKKKKTTSGDSTTTKKTKKTKKSEEKENISVEPTLAEPVETLSLISHSTSASDADDLLNVSVRDIKSSFSKFDQLAKQKTVIHVRSVDSTKAQKQFSDATAGNEVSSNCKSCGKMVFQMEQIKAERAVWHKNCFRCKECSKQLTLDTYSSHEGVVYCKPHFKELFKPKAVIEDEEPTSDKPDLGLEELASLNVRSRFQVFEKGDENDENDKSTSVVNVKRSPSILSKVARFQGNGSDVGVTDDSLNGAPFDQSPSSTEEEEDEDDSTNRKVVKSRKIRERPMSFGKMEDVKSVWENGVAKTKEELREERKQEMQQIRSRLFMGKQVKMKEAYEQAVRESEQTGQTKKTVETIRSDKARSIKECFEKGEPLNVDDEDNEEGRDMKKSISEDTEMFEAGISKKSRSLFLELDKSAKAQSQNGPKPAPRTPATPTKSHEDESPDKEIYRDPNVVRAADKVEPELVRTNTTAKMLTLFRQLEERTEEVPDGPKPLKCFTPPPDYKEDETEESEEESEEEESDEVEDENEVNPNIVRASDKVEDDYLKQAANAARAKQLRAKFEKWEEQEIKREQEEQKERRLNGSTNVDIIDSSETVEVTSIECTKNLRARFESLRTETEQPKDKVPRPKVNRFVEIQNTCEDLCEACHTRVYQLEKIETSGKMFHKSCFRCVQCNCLLRLEAFTLNCGKPYCMPHFRQLFTVKGNYDEGFGVDQHKAKWSRIASTC